MRRRALLASATTFLAAAVTGCSGFRGDANPAGNRTNTASLELVALPDADLPSRVLYTVRRYDVPDPDADRFERILDGGETMEGTSPPFPEAQHIAFEDGVYELSHDVVERTPATRYSVTLNIVQGSVRENRAIQFADLPEADRTVFAREGLADGETIGIGTSLLYTDAERDQSVLVPDPEYAYIVWADGAEATWTVDDAFDTSLNTYRYTAEEVATAAEYGRQMRERFAFELSGLPSAERDIVRTAIEDEQYVVGPDETPTSAFAALADRFRDREQAHALDADGEVDLSGRYLVRYDGEVYWTTLVVREPLATASSD